MSEDRRGSSEVLEGLSKEEIDDYEDAFKHFDKDNDGFIDSLELATVLRSLGYSPTKEQLTNLMSIVDLDGNGGISFDEFVTMMRKGDMETDFDKEIKGAFRFIDKNNDGVVDRQELEDIMRGLGEKLASWEIELLLNEADTNGDGKISLKEFIMFMYD